MKLAMANDETATDLTCDTKTANGNSVVLTYVNHETVPTDGDSKSPINVPKRNKVVETRQLVRYDDLYSSGTESATPEEDDDDSSDSSTEILKTVLTPIEREVKGYDVGAMPENGSQFLLHVMHERKKLPKIVNAPKSRVEKIISTKPVDETKPFKITKVPKCVETPTTLQEFLPTQCWISIVTHQFCNLSLKVEYWRAMMAEQGSSITLPDGIVLPPPNCTERKWLLFCFGTKLYEQLNSNPRLRKGVSTADTKAISSFFSDEIGSEALCEAPGEKELPAIEALQLTEADTALESAPVLPGIESSETIAEHIDASDDVQSDAGSVSNSVTSLSEAVEEEDPFHEKQTPLISILLNLPVTTVEDLLAMQVSWLTKYGWFHEYQGKWIYALLACLVRPLPCDVVSDIRKLVRICCELRMRVCESKMANENPLVDQTDDESRDSTKLPTTGIVNTEDENANREESIRFKEFINTLNLFICLVSNYFQQFDLADIPRP